MKRFALLVLIFSYNIVFATEFSNKQSKRSIDHLLKNRDNIIGIELIIVDKSKAAASRFGHAMLRFVDNDQDVFNDIVIAFVAEVNDKKIDYMKGFTGGYNIIVEAMPIIKRWKQYAKYEGRKLNRFIIPTPRKFGNN